MAMKAECALDRCRVPLLTMASELDPFTAWPLRRQRVRLQGEASLHTPSSCTATFIPANFPSRRSLDAARRVLVNVLYHLIISRQPLQRRSQLNR